MCMGSSSTQIKGQLIDSPKEGNESSRLQNVRSCITVGLCSSPVVILSLVAFTAVGGGRHSKGFVILGTCRVGSTWVRFQFQGVSWQ